MSRSYNHLDVSTGGIGQLIMNMTPDLPGNDTEWFEDWFGSPYYKMLYNNRNEQEAHAFIDTLVHYLQPVPGCRMLDIACGEGRFAKQLANLGYDVTGIDLSPENIEIAQKAAHAHLHFLTQDMRFLFYVNYFDYSFNFFTSFGYFQYDRDDRLAANAFAASLKKGGTLVLDYMNSALVTQNLMPKMEILRDGVHFHIEKRIAHGRILKTIRITDGDQPQRVYTEQVTAFTLSDLNRLFTSAGLTLVQTFGDYQLAPFREESSPRLILLFKKN